MVAGATSPTAATINPTSSVGVSLTRPPPFALTLLNEMKSIHDTFLRPTAPFEINLSATIRDDLNTKVNDYLTFFNDSTILPDDNSITEFLAARQQQTEGMLVADRKEETPLPAAAARYQLSPPPNSSLNMNVDINNNPVVTPISAPSSTTPVLPPTSSHAIIRLGIASSISPLPPHAGVAVESNNMSNLVSSSLPYDNIHDYGSGGRGTPPLLVVTTNTGTIATAPIPGSVSSSSTPLGSAFGSSNALGRIRAPIDDLCIIMRHIFDPAQEAILTLMQVLHLANEWHIALQ
jgi:hypothetical protein